MSKKVTSLRTIYNYQNHLSASFADDSNCRHRKIFKKNLIKTENVKNQTAKKRVKNRGGEKPRNFVVVN